MAVVKSSKKYKNKNKKKSRKNINNSIKKKYRKNTGINTKRKKELVLKEVNNLKNNNDKALIEKNTFLEDRKENINFCDNLSSNHRNYWRLIIVSLIIFVLGLIVVYFPRIVLIGDNQIVMGYNDNYIEPGYNGYIYNKDITDKVNVVSNITNGVLGYYEVNYYIDLLGARVRKTRNVRIVDEISPKINVSEEVVQVCPNERIPEIKYEAIDEYDGNVTARVEKFEKDDEVLFRVSDLSNNFTEVSVKINRVDNEKPSIKLKGSLVMYLNYGSTFKEPGFSASDNCNGDITDRVVISGSVGRKIGTYELKYEVSDDFGNKDVVTRKVIIGAKVNDNGSINKGTIYLTFDDGPNQGTTNKILDILKKENVKATFFVTCKGPDSLIRRMYEEGHTVALHTASHEYSYIYSSVNNYFNDLNKVRDRVKGITGIDSKIIRFPGGSSNTISRSYNKGIMTELSNIVLNQGYRYFDWNVDGMDASTARTSGDVYYNVTSNLSHNRANVVLLHDTKSITANAVKDIIEFGKENGYKFSAIDMDTYMVRHSVNN